MSNAPWIASVNPYFASWLMRYALADSQVVRDTAERLHSAGRPDLIAHLVEGVEQLRASAVWYRAQIAGTAELAGAELDAELLSEVVTVAVAAELLGVSQGMCRRLCRSGALAARHVSGRPWEIQRTSVTDRLEARRTADD